jgi:transcription antitermination factor NusG
MEMEWQMEFPAGNQVRVIDGTFAGMTGTVATSEQAKALWEKNGGQAPPLKIPTGLVFVVLELFGKHVPVILESWQLNKLP